MQTILTNSIICGDCKDKMHQHIPSGSIDLIYMDPPFFSGKNYEIVWKDGAEVRSFEDTEFYTLECECGKVFPENHLYCAFCGAGKDKATERRSNDIEAYLQWLRPKLEECHRVLKQTGSIYVHLDWHAVHYVKVMMDEIFGRNNFQNEIVWCYSGGGVPKTAFARKHDTILVYAKTNSKDRVFNIRYMPYSDASRKLVKGRGGTSIDGKKRDLDRGAHMNDWWNDLNALQTWSPEKLGYPTQKPEALLERIIKASSNPGDLVLDPFCGCGTAIAVAQNLGRRWIGIDVSPTSCRLMTDRLRKIRYSIGESDIIDMPYTIEGLKTLPPFEFQNWAVTILGGQQAQKKVADGGIDGWTFTGDPIQVKQSEKVGVNTVKMLAHDTMRVGKTKAIIVAFSYGKGAYKGVESVKSQFGIDIELKTVAEMIE